MNVSKISVGNVTYAVIKNSDLEQLVISSKYYEGAISYDISEERRRQKELHPQDVTLEMRYVTIMEELGEVAEALQDEDYEQVYRELIESASTCIRMAEEVISKKNNGKAWR